MDYPATAVKITFKPLGAPQHVYRVWKIGSKYAWFALGQSGIADNMESAMRSAREYISDGIGGMARESRQQTN